MDLIIGTKTWSSWSLRAWLPLRRAGAVFRETVIALNHHGVTEQLAATTPTARVPALRLDDGTLICDSLAICEWAAEMFPQARLWPYDPVARALGRSAAAEMHSGFASLRGECSMDLRLSTVAELSPATQADVRRIVALWSELRARFGAAGPYLLGDWSIADAFYTPVATRFRSYGIRPSDYGDAGAAEEYLETVLRTPEFLEWEAQAAAETL